MLIVSILSTFTVLVHAADYSPPAAAPSPPANYVSEKPAAVPLVKASDIALIAKLVEQLQGYGHSLPGPLYVGDGMLTEQSYPEADLSSLLKLLYQGKPKKHGITATVKYLNPIPGLYGDPSYALDSSHLTAAYKRPALGLLHALASPVNLLYQHPPPAYHVHFAPGHKLPLSPAGIFGYPGYAPPPPAALAPVPVIIITKKHVDEEDYEADSDEVTEAPAVVDYAPKPNKHVIKVVAPIKKTPALASYGPVKAKLLPKPITAKVYSKTAKVKPVVVVNKAKTYPKKVKVTVPAEPSKTSYSPMTIKAAKPYIPTEATIAAVEVSAPVAAVPKYVAVPTVAPVAAAPKYVALPTPAPAAPATVVVAKPADDAQPAPDAAVSADAASISEPDAGESARASLPETKISSQQTISRIS